MMEIIEKRRVCTLVTYGMCRRLRIIVQIEMRILRKPIVRSLPNLGLTSNILLKHILISYTHLWYSQSASRHKIESRKILFVPWWQCFCIKWTRSETARWTPTIVLKFKWSYLNNDSTYFREKREIQKLTYIYIYTCTYWPTIEWLMCSWGC